MNPGELMVILATLTSLGAFVTRAFGEKLDIKNLSAALSLLTFAVLSAALIFLGYLFLSSDMSYFYVWASSSTDLASMYKLSGVWAGADGSFLLWIWFVAFVLAVEVMLEPRRKYLSKKFHALFQASISGVLFVFLLLLLNMNLFEETSAFLLQTSPGGNGMQLSLQTPEMILHPPVVFAGYAFCIATFAAAVAYFLTKESNWVSISLPWGRLVWLFLTLGIGIGAIWAYYVLGWGGYWAWDPVETSSLLPWLMVTAFLHTQLRHSRKGEYGVLSPALGMVALISVLFATFTTRAGSIWASSVHAFGTSVGDTAGARLSYLLGHDSTVLGIFTLMLALLVVTVYLSYDKYRRIPRKDEEPEPEKFSEYISDKNNMMLSVGLLLATSAIMLFILFKNVNVTQAANLNEFNQKMSLFFVLLMITMSTCLVWKVLGKELAFWLAAGMLVVSVALALISAMTGSYDWLVAFSVPSYVVAVGASGYRIAKSRVKGSIRKTLQKVSPQLVHLGVALILVSFVISENMQVFPADLQSISGLSGTEISVGGEVRVGDYTVRLAEMRVVDKSATSGGMVVDEAREAVVNVLRSGDSLRTNVVLSNLYGHDTSGSPHVMKIDVYIYKSILNDLYLDFQWVNDNTAFIQVKVVPMMNFLWAGFGLLAIGLAVRTVVWRQEPKETEPVSEKEEPKRPRAPKPDVPAKSEKDYESIVEEELKRFKEKRSK